MAKQYGLIIPGKTKKPELPKVLNFIKPSAFGSDSEDEEGDFTEFVKNRPSTGPKISSSGFNLRQARAIQEKALAEDPTVFQYDELYDGIEMKREEEKNAKKLEIKKPKYIEKLMQHAEKRKLENERRIERMVQKEREAEGEQFKDKDSYVTSAYRKKLEELKKAEEEEKREEYLESIGDVTKQQNLDGFYRHLYEQKLGPKESTAKEVVPDDDISSVKIPKISRPRTYRKRQSSNDEEDNELDNKNNQTSTSKIHIQSNLDADSDFSIDSSSDSDESDKENPRKKDSTEIAVTEIKKEINIEASKVEESVSKEELKSSENIKEAQDEDKKESVIAEPVPKKPKIDIWKKRTVCEVFDGALQRYYERKAAKGS